MRFRHPAIVALLLAVLLPRIAFPQSRPNLVPNGSFEDALASWQCSVNDPKQVGAAVNLDSSRTREGNRSLKIQLAGPGSATATSPLAPVQAGQDYLLTFWYRSEGFSDTGLFAGVNLQYVLDWLDTDKKPVGTGGMGLSYGAVAEWRFMVSLLTAPPSTPGHESAFPCRLMRRVGLPSAGWAISSCVRGWANPNRVGRYGVSLLRKGRSSNSFSAALPTTIRPLALPCWPTHGSTGTPATWLAASTPVSCRLVSTGPFFG